MASVSTGQFALEYSMISGVPREITINGETVYRSKSFAALLRPPYNCAVEPDGWKDILTREVLMADLHHDDGHGYRAFVYWMHDNGLLNLWKH